jgi:hypothetical protein
MAADHGQRRAQLVRRVRHEIAARALDVLLVRHVAHDREPLIGAVGDDLHVQPPRLVARRRHRDSLARRPVQISGEVGMAQKIVDAMADVGGVVEAEQPGRRRVEPHDFLVGVQDDAAVGQRARAFAHLPQQPVIALLAIARLRSQLVDAREDLGPQAARLEQRHAPVAVERSIEQVEVPQREGQIARRRAEQPPADVPKRPTEQERCSEQPREGGDLGSPPARQFHGCAAENR